MSKIVDNLSNIIGRTAVYTCDMTALKNKGIDIPGFINLLEDRIPRSIHLDDYLEENFYIEPTGELKLDIQLKEPYESVNDLIHEYKFLKKRKIKYSDIDHLCIANCKFDNNDDGPFCNVCLKKYNNVTEDKINKMKEQMLNHHSSNISYKYKEIKRFLCTPLPEFTYTHWNPDGRIEAVFKCTSIIDSTD